MKGFQFQLEYKTDKDRKAATRAKLGNHMGTVIALSTESKPYTSGRDVMQEGFTAVYCWADSDVCWGATSRDYLRTRCLRLSEAEARKIHPSLFTRLDLDQEHDKRIKAEDKAKEKADKAGNK